MDDGPAPSFLLNREERKDLKALFLVGLGGLRGSPVTGFWSGEGISIFGFRRRALASLELFTEVRIWRI
jgi:hypothetical protein